MSTGKIKPVKYIFLDVVEYSTRTVEAQSDIISALNGIVKDVVTKKLPEGRVIYIPIGDGICIALIDSEVNYDDHIQIALDIVRRIVAIHNQQVQDTRKFEVRIGINENVDNLIIDINDNENVTGAGVNYAQRIMSFADASQILVGRTTYESLRHREKYTRAFRGYQATAKHNVRLEVFQYIGGNVAALNREVPSAFAPKEPPKEPPLSKVAAYYFAHCIKNRQFIREKRGPGKNNYALRLLFWCLARDSVGESESSEWEPYTKDIPETTHNTLDEQFELFMRLPFWVCSELGQRVLEDEGIFETKFYEDPYYFTAVNIEGQNKLRSEWPEIWKEFKLDELAR